FGAEGMPAADEHIGQAGERVDIVSCIGALAVEDLRARVPRGRDRRAIGRSGHRRASERGVCCSEVENPNLSLVRDENVAGIEISMDYGARMRVPDGSPDVANDGE